MGARGLFDRFGASARRVLAHAVDEARALGHDVVGAEHLLIALAAQDDSTGSVLRDAGITADKLRERVAVERPGEPLPEVKLDPLTEEETAELVARLREQGVSAPKVREMVRRIQRRRSGGFDLENDLKQALERAVRFSGEVVDTTDLLLAVLREPTTTVARICGWAGPSPDDLVERFRDQGSG